MSSSLWHPLSKPYPLYRIDPKTGERTEIKHTKIKFLETPEGQIQKEIFDNEAAENCDV